MSKALYDATWFRIIDAQNLPERYLANMQEYLYVVRVALGYTKKELADILGVSQTTMYHIENGKISISKPYFIALYCILSARIWQLCETEPWLSENNPLLFFVSSQYVSEKQKSALVKTIRDTVEDNGTCIGMSNLGKIIRRNFIEPA